MKRNKGGLMKAIIIITSILFFVSVAHANTLRCGHDLVSIGDHKLIVEEKCGGPQSKDRIAYEVQRGFEDDYRLYRYIDEWIYDSRKNPKIRKTKRLIRLIFEENLLKRIETLTTY
jgi:hypothetical protein